MNHKPLFIALAGSIGAGKTTLAYGLRQTMADLVILENDTVRREVLGFPLAYFMNHDLDDSFSPENNQRVFDTVEHRVHEALQAEKPVLQSLVLLQPHEFIDVANKYQHMAQFIGLYLQADEATIRHRLLQRKYERATLAELNVAKGHASDADENVLLKFPVQQLSPVGWTVIDAGQEKSVVLAAAMAAIAQASSTTRSA